MNERRHDIEYTLPLHNHSLELVVQYQDLYSDTELAGCLELHGGHAEASISIDIDNGLVWSGDFCTDSRWQTETHSLRRSPCVSVVVPETGGFEWKKTYAKTTTGHHTPWDFPPIVLGCPHLMLSHTGRNDGLFLPPSVLPLT